ncbi:TrpR-related protein YerC/YecD [Arcanobacterium wilhelmae]|uniref:TrpR-related protein YerC/YecD n=1 Tax=Arcanobacterium wilhelmae TaxID=1803177 RepID=A0ABT9N8Q2_9ACTO|nr:YerC/YecD family TrpR-related protein [Arcanobacterium wilhelmae]MDP9800075.1 TrpR-related protein YerC/YecD [Arcanobacterium wilhelmae]WFN89569.1 YerC/YecD family TrpR-related protein [Arcanobacterium wilhelmae]
MERKIGQLSQAIADLESADAVRAFLEDLCTIREIQDMAQRLEAARMLEDGASYQEVSDELAISSATIARVNKALHYGAGGYKAVLARLGSQKSRHEG